MIGVGRVVLERGIETWRTHENCIPRRDCFELTSNRLTRDGMSVLTYVNAPKGVTNKGALAHVVEVVVDVKTPNAPGEPDVRSNSVVYLRQVEVAAKIEVFSEIDPTELTLNK